MAAGLGTAILPGLALRALRPGVAATEGWPARRQVLAVTYGEQPAARLRSSDGSTPWRTPPPPRRWRRPGGGRRGRWTGPRATGISRRRLGTPAGQRAAPRLARRGIPARIRRGTPALARVRSRWSRPAQYGSRSLRFSSLPVGSRGSSSMKSIDLRPLDTWPAGRSRCSMISRGELRRRRTPGSGLDDRLDLLAHVVVGDAEHGDVGDLRVLEDLALDLGRIDVHAAGDDHVGLAVAEEQVAVLVEVADVADGEEALGVVVARRSWPCRPCTRSRRRPSASTRCRAPRRGDRLPSSSAILQLADRPRRCRPCRGTCSHSSGVAMRAAALGRARSTPRSPGPTSRASALHVDRARRRGVDRPLHRRHVVLRPARPPGAAACG